MKYSHITIAGRICTGKSTVRKYLQDTLGWEGFSTGEIFREYIKEHNLQLERVEEQDRIGREVDASIQKRLREENNLVIDTWINGVLSTSLPTVCKVLLVCDDTVRIQRFMEREGVTKQEASRRIDNRESALLTKLSSMYNIDDILDPKHYNIVIDTTNLSINEIGDQIIAKMRS
ncbi:MAG: Cytidylate kinase [Microgenomates bacterium OLB23]|nr:MAG: Cytidylate kinase [Microgenomates bacterium OLB23]